MRALLSACLVVLAAAGCAHRAGTGAADTTAPSATMTFTEDVRVDVDNQNFLDAVIYLLRQGSATRIGQVTGSSRATLHISKELLNGTSRQIQLQADPVGSASTVTSQSAFIRPGESIRLTLEPDFRAVTMIIIR